MGPVSEPPAYSNSYQSTGKRHIKSKPLRFEDTFFIRQLSDDCIINIIIRMKPKDFLTFMRTSKWIYGLINQNADKIKFKLTKVVTISQEKTPEAIVQLAQTIQTFRFFHFSILEFLNFINYERHWTIFNVILSETYSFNVDHLIFTNTRTNVETIMKLQPTKLTVSIDDNLLKSAEAPSKKKKTAMTKFLCTAVAQSLNNSLEFHITWRGEDLEDATFFTYLILAACERLAFYKTDQIVYFTVESAPQLVMDGLRLELSDSTDQLYKGKDFSIHFHAGKCGIISFVILEIPESGVISDIVCCYVPTYVHFVQFIRKIAVNHTKLNSFKDTSSFRSVMLDIYHAVRRKENYFPFEAGDLEDLSENGPYFKTENWKMLSSVCHSKLEKANKEITFEFAEELKNRPITIPPLFMCLESEPPPAKKQRIDNGIIILDD